MLFVVFSKRPMHLDLCHWWYFLVWVFDLVFVKWLFIALFAVSPTCQVMGQMSSDWCLGWVKTGA